MTIALLSNINCDPIARRVGQAIDCVTPDGYGNVLETLLRPDSVANREGTQAVVIIMDMAEMLTDSEDARQDIDQFFAAVEASMQPGRQYFVNDADYEGAQAGDYSMQDDACAATLHWNARLREFCSLENGNMLPYGALARQIGAENFYSAKSWYLGSVRHTVAGVAAIAGQILAAAGAMAGHTKKVLVLDLDNTLWGGVVGEEGTDGIVLMSSGKGRAYQDFQRACLQMRKNGVLLAIVSKNNEADAMDVLENHPHMVLRKDDFAAMAINWEGKARNIQSLAATLNVGLDSMVFIDDNPLEREEVKAALPEVTVPDFPASPELLPGFGRQIARSYFMRLAITKEDREKTQQYRSRAQIESARQAAPGDYKEFLRNLDIKVEAKDPAQNMARVMQLIQKTNQFNTTVRRYSQSEMEGMLASPEHEVFLFNVADRLANHGLCALVAVHAKEEPVIEAFVMSCRVMGREIEYGILDYVQAQMAAKGHESIGARFIAGPKNMPVEQLYDNAGYDAAEKREGETFYHRALPGESGRFVGTVM